MECLLFLLWHKNSLFIVFRHFINLNTIDKGTITIVITTHSLLYCNWL